MSKGLMKYKRVAQRMREQFGNERFSVKDLEEAIFVEIGTDPRTIRASIDRMLRLKLMKKCDPVREFGVMPKEEYELTDTNDEYF